MYNTNVYVILIAIAALAAMIETAGAGGPAGSGLPRGPRSGGPPAAVVY